MSLNLLVSACQSERMLAYRTCERGERVSLEGKRFVSFVVVIQQRAHMKIRGE